MSERLQARVYDELAKLAVEVEWEWLRLPQIRKLVAERAVQAVGDTSTVTGEAYDGELDMARHLIRTLRLVVRPDDADMGEVRRLLHHHAGDSADARDQAAERPEFFRRGRTYSSGVWQFRCVHLVAHPVDGHVRAWGWFGREGRGWRHAAFSERQYATRPWVDVTEEATP